MRTPGKSATVIDLRLPACLTVMSPRFSHPAATTPKAISLSARRWRWQLRSVVAELRGAPQFARYVPATAILVETLLSGGDKTDLCEVEAAVEQLASAAGEDLVLREIMLLRLRALLARAQGDKEPYRQYRDRYRAMAKSLGFEGHMKWAEAMP